jgi:hypothetical protein
MEGATLRAIHRAPMVVWRRSGGRGGRRRVRRPKARAGEGEGDGVLGANGVGTTMGLPTHGDKVWHAQSSASTRPTECHLASTIC